MFKLANFQLQKRFSPVGIDWGDSCIKLVQFKRDKGRVVLHRYSIFTLPEERIQGNGGGSFPVDKYSTCLREKIEEAGFVGRVANLGISSQNVMIRFVTLPLMPAREIPAAVNWEARRLKDNNVGEIIADYAFNKEKIEEGRESIEVLMVAATPEVVRGYVEAAGKAGVTPQAVEIEPFSLHRAARFGEALFAEDNSYLNVLLDIGGEYSNLLIMKEGEYVFSRVLSIGVNHFCRQVAVTNALEETEAAKLVFGDDPFSVAGFSQIARDMTELIRRSLQYYVQRFQEGEGALFQYIFLCGGGSSINGLGDYWEQEFSMCCRQFNPFHLGDMIEESLLEDIQIQQLSRLGGAAGLALRGWV